MHSALIHASHFFCASRHSSSMPMLSNAFQRLRVGAAVQLRRSSNHRAPKPLLLYAFAFLRRNSAPSHVLLPLIPRSAGQPQQFRSMSSQAIAKAFRRSAIASRCRSYPSQSTAFPMYCKSVPLLSASVPQQIEASPLQICAPRSRSIARLVFAQRTLHLPAPPFRCWQ